VWIRLYRGVDYVKQKTGVAQVLPVASLMGGDRSQLATSMTVSSEDCSLGSSLVDPLASNNNDSSHTAGPDRDHSNLHDDSDHHQRQHHHHHHHSFGDGTGLPGKLTYGVLPSVSAVSPRGAVTAARFVIARVGDGDDDLGVGSGGGGTQSDDEALALVRHFGTPRLLQIGDVFRVRRGLDPGTSVAPTSAALCARRISAQRYRQSHSGNFAFGGWSLAPSSFRHYVVEWAETTEPEAPELPIPHRVCVCRGFCFLLFVFFFFSAR
jgi:hypothetical protein